MKKSFTHWLNSHKLKNLSMKTVVSAGLFMMVSMAANSQTNYYIRLDSVNKSAKAVKLKPSIPSSWTDNPIGIKGNSPANFTTANQIFNIQTNGYVNALNWKVSGAGSKIVVGTKDSIITKFTTSSPLNATVDVYAGSSLTLTCDNTDTLTFGNLGVNSTIIYSGSSNVCQKVIPFNYVNLSLSPSATSLPLDLPTSPISISGVYTTNSKFASIYGKTIIFNGLGGQAIPAGNYYNLTISGNKLVPDTLKGVVNVAAVFSDISTGAQTLSHTVSPTGVVTAATLSFNGFLPQTVSGREFYNLSFTNGQAFTVASFSNANKTITLFQKAPELAIGHKISGNPEANGTTLVLDTSTVITNITNDTILTLSNAPTIRGFINHAGHATGVKPDTIYITAYNLADSSIKLASVPTTLLVGDTLNSQIVANKTLAIGISGNSVTLSALKSINNTYNSGSITIGSADRKPSDKTMIGNFSILNSFSASATGLGTAVLGKVNTTGVPTFSYIGKKQRVAGIIYNNLVINQDSATAAGLSGPALVLGTFTLASGKLNTTIGNILTLDVNATFPPVSNDTFFVSGPLAKKFNSTAPFTYQIGQVDKAGISYPRTAVITPATADTKTYIVSYVRNKVIDSLISPQLNAIADTFSYYNVMVSNYSAGSDTSAKISFQFNPTYAIDSNLVLAHAINGQFVAESPAFLNSTGTKTILTTNGYDNIFGHFTLATASATYLPVKFGSITADAVGNVIKVSWQSLSEVNVSSYIVESSVDGVEFTAKGIVIAKGASTYSFNDNAPNTGISYYRIKEVDKNGIASYSSVISVKESTITTSLSVFPNPLVNRKLNFVLNNHAANYNLKVTNILGQSVLAKTISHLGGSASYNVTLPKEIKAGTYFVKFSSSNYSTTRTIIVE